jgi:chromosome segregation ATPase
LKAENTSLQQQLIQTQAQLEEANQQLATLATDREGLPQFKKEAKEVAAELHREERSMELEKTRWQQQLSDARAELADAKATILNQGNKIRELERGYSLKPNPKESALRLEIGNLQAEITALKQQLEQAQSSQPAAAKELPEAAELLNQLISQRKKSKAVLADVEALLGLIEGE